MGEGELRVQFRFQSVISAFQTCEQKTDTLNRNKSVVRRDITILITKRDEICSTMKPERYLNVETC